MESSFTSPLPESKADPDDGHIGKRLSCATRIMRAISEALYTSCIGDLHLRDHYCSMRHPCVLAQGALFPLLLNFRLVCVLWNGIVTTELGDRFLQSQTEIEAVYYPYEWHVNTKVRRAILHGRFRVYRTIDTEDGDRGVFRAYDYRSSASRGCQSPSQVIIKAWLEDDDNECQTEQRAYAILDNASATIQLAVPKLLAKGWDDEDTLFSLVLEDVGISLDTLLSGTGALKQRPIVGLAMQLIDCYAAIHRLGIIHNGVKPGNICIAPTANRIYLIDFGLSYFLDVEKLPFTGTGTSISKEDLKSLFSQDTGQIVGNRTFLSVLGQRGMPQSQRDDLESLGYLFSYMRHGRLPWSHKDSKIWQVKMATPASVLFDKMDVCFIKYWKDVKSLAFGEMPDYNTLKGYFMECWERNNFSGSPGESVTGTLEGH